MKPIERLVVDQLLAEWRERAALHRRCAGFASVLNIQLKHRECSHAWARAAEELEQTVIEGTLLKDIPPWELHP